MSLKGNPHAGVFIFSELPRIGTLRQWDGLVRALYHLNQMDFAGLLASQASEQIQYPHVAAIETPNVALSSRGSYFAIWITFRGSLQDCQAERLCSRITQILAC